MVRNLKNFPVLYKDEWGNPYAECPVCKQVCKVDGLIKHIIGRSQRGDDNHKKWLEENHPQDSKKLS